MYWSSTVCWTVVSTQIFTHWAERPSAKPSSRYAYWLKVGPMTSVTRPPISSQMTIQLSFATRLTPSGVTTAARPNPIALATTRSVT